MLWTWGCPSSAAATQLTRFPFHFRESLNLSLHLSTRHQALEHYYNHFWWSKSRNKNYLQFSKREGGHCRKVLQTCRWNRLNVEGTWRHNSCVWCPWWIWIWGMFSPSLCASKPCQWWFSTLCQGLVCVPLARFPQSIFRFLLLWMLICPEGNQVLLPC